jgi:hypothetical protein
MFSQRFQSLSVVSRPLRIQNVFVSLCSIMAPTIYGRCEMLRRLLLPCFFVFVSHAAAQPGPAIYNDPQNRFRVAVPREWTAVPAGDTVQLVRGNAFANVLITRANGDADTIISTIAGELGQGWLGFQRGQSARIQWASHPAAVAVYSGVNPTGVRVVLKFNAAIVGERAYVLVMAAPQQEIPAINAGFIEIENSFTIASARTAPGGMPPDAPGAALPAPAAGQPAVRSSVPTQTQKGGVPVRLLQSGTCFAIAPPDWSIVAVATNSNGVDVTNEKMHAGWSMTGIDTAMAGFYPQYGSPELFLNWLMSSNAASMGESGYRFTSSKEFAGFTVREFETDRFRGMVMIRVYPGPSPTSFVLSYRGATVSKQSWETDLPVAVAVALSIRCTVTLSVPDSSGRRRDEASEASTYNQQLGTEYAHSTATGENFLMSHAEDWLENGPQGPGYYRKSGNDYEKLVPGLSGP